MTSNTETILGTPRSESGPSLGVDACTAPVSDYVARVRYLITLNAGIAKRSLGLSDSIEKAEAAQMRETIRTYATAIELEGAAELPMYDEHPWVATYFSPRTLRLALPGLTTLGVRRTVTAAFLLHHARKQWHARIGRRSRMDNRFVILDEFNRPVMIGELQRKVVGHRRGRTRFSVQWMPAADASEVHNLKERAKERDDLGSFEAGWDNFSTAEGLWKQASDLRESASCAQYASLLFQ